MITPQNMRRVLTIGSVDQEISNINSFLGLIYLSIHFSFLLSDIRDTVNYKEVMKQYSLGPNGGIVTSLNLFATRFDQVVFKNCVVIYNQTSISSTSI